MTKKSNRVTVVLVILLLISSMLAYCMYFSSSASWKEDEKGKKYEDEDGNFLTGFQDIEGYMYYFDSDGYMKTGKIYVEDEDAYYFADDNGIIQIGTFKDDDSLYITDDKGRISIGFVDYDGERYYINGKAELVKGWFKVEDNWYYSDSTGKIATGMMTINGYRYYFGDGGVRVSDTVMEIEGVTYVFNSDGSVDENATTLYPAYEYIRNVRNECGLNDILLEPKVQACAIYRAGILPEGYSEDSDNELERLLQNRGVKCNGGYELSYGGSEGYNTDMLIEHMKKDNNFNTIIRDEAIQYVGMGVHVEENISYYDIIFITGSDN